MNHSFSDEGAGATDCMFVIASDLYHFMTNVQKPKPLDRTWMESVQKKCVELRERALQVRERSALQQVEVGKSLARVAESLQQYGQELENSASVRHLKRTQRVLAQGYEQLRVELTKNSSEQSESAPLTLHRLKTINYSRNLFHVVNGLGGAFLYEYVLSFKQVFALAIFVAVSGIIMEVTRLAFPRWNDFLVGKVFHSIARPWEKHHVNSATYYSIALVIIVGLLSQHAAEIGCVVLAISDPAATLAGRRWGKLKVWNEKSYVGTGVFFLSAALTCVVFARIWVPELPFPASLAMAATVAAGGAMAEVFSDRLDDNFTITVLCAAIASFWF